MDLVEARVGEGASVSLVCVVISSIPVAINWTRDYLPLALGQVSIVCVLGREGGGGTCLLCLNHLEIIATKRDLTWDFKFSLHILEVL